MMATFPLTLTAIINNQDPVPVISFDITKRVDTMCTGAAPSKTWDHVDEHGHYHAWSTDPDNPYPTLKKYQRYISCDGMCGDGVGCGGVEITGHRCVLCGDEVTPGVTRFARKISVGPSQAEWSLVVPVWLELGTQVSVRLLGPGGIRMFGGAMVSDCKYHDSGAGCVSDLVGVTELGYRPGPELGIQPDQRIPVQGDSAGYSQWRK